LPPGLVVAAVVAELAGTAPAVPVASRLGRRPVDRYDAPRLHVWADGTAVVLVEWVGRSAVRRHGSRARLSFDLTGRVTLSLKRPLRDGRTELTFTPIDFLRRLATLIPPPRRHLTRYHGVFAPHHHLRTAIVPAAAAAADQPSARWGRCWLASRRSDASTGTSSITTHASL